MCRCNTSPAWWCLPEQDTVSCGTPWAHYCTSGDPLVPSPWNRTRTSRFSAERADQLRERGIRGVVRAFEACARRPDHHHHHLRLSESALHPSRRSGLQIGSRKKRLVCGRKQRRPLGVCPGGLHVVTSSRAYSAGPPARVSVPRYADGETKLGQRRMAPCFRPSFPLCALSCDMAFGSFEPLMVDTDNSGTSICQHHFRRRISDPIPFAELNRNFCCNGSVSTSKRAKRS